ncbi:tRNA(Ile)-lysidine synthase [Novosphingobium chloroacetimidivorans]|uniref:tRNA(Ile)-lysidine synthase n=1 Tax=Novosphingobium chloroacetimidivorans TaxID=1428314 RepID=A0A7W7NXV8_9SPHN|nr:tRNA lysidine(34) synthetase TilS [Novosphingobium chloroacetimidivorans]MBB4859522.1 tRNA(Ile)-lysidine synthase [Novosphingobium chloroacetimidivorans]
MASSAVDRLSVPAELSARFGEALRAVWPECDAELAPMLGIAVSGGPDSTALLLLAASTLPGRIAAATVDHGLRPENAQEAADMAALCAVLGVAHATLPVTLEPGNVQGAARQARYAALGAWAQAEGLAAVATAHHADDQAETLIMRLNRASGVAGLAGVRARGRLLDTPIGLVRPLLGWRRAELTAIVAKAGVSAADDPSNADDRFDRARLRKVLAGADWLDMAAIAQSAAHIADADAALNWSADMEYNARVKRDPFGMTYRPMAPKAIALRVIARIVAELDAPARGSAIARLFDALVAGEPASIGNLVVRPNAGGWSFAKAPVRKAMRGKSR